MAHQRVKEAGCKLLELLLVAARVAVTVSVSPALARNLLICHAGRAHGELLVPASGEDQMRVGVDEPRQAT